MVTTLHSFGAVSRHGDMHLSLGIVPGNSETKVSCAIPLLGCLIVEVYKFFSDVFDPEIVSTEGKGDRSLVMLPVARGSCTLPVTFSDQPYFEEFLCSDASLWQSIHTFLDVDIDITIRCGFVV